MASKFKLAWPVIILLVILIAAAAAVAIVAIPFVTILLLINMMANRGNVTIFKPKAAIKPKAKIFQKIQI